MLSERGQKCFELNVWSERVCRPLGRYPLQLGSELGGGRHGQSGRRVKSARRVRPWASVYLSVSAMARSA